VFSDGVLKMKPFRIFDQINYFHQVFVTVNFVIEVVETVAQIIWLGIIAVIQI
jgi:hypothetical protein